MLRWALMWMFALVLGAMACGSGGPEEQSGADAYRDGAERMPMDEWVPGDVDRDGADRTDWKAFVVEEPGALTVALSADEEAAAVEVGVYDRYGYALESAVRRAGSDAPVEVVVDAKLAGLYFIRIRHAGGVATAYSVQATMGSPTAAEDDEGGAAPMPDL